MITARIGSVRLKPRRCGVTRNARHWRIILAAAGALTLMGSPTARADKYYIGPANGNWNTAANWSNTSGGAAGTMVPGATDNVFITNSDDTNRNVTLDAGDTILALTIDNNDDGVDGMTQSANVTLNVTSAIGEIIGNKGNGSYSQSAGTNNETGNNTSSSLQLGYGTFSNGTYTLTGGTVLVASTGSGFLTVGSNGDGTFTQTGGTVILGDGPDTGAFVLGAGTTASGTYTLGGTGYLNVTGYEFIGSRGFGLLQEYGGAFIQTNGTNTVNGDQYIGYSDFSTGVYTLSGGADNVAGNLYAGVNGDGVFNLTGGSLVVAAGGGTITLPGTGTILAQGGALIGFSSLSDGTFNQSGGTATIGTASARGNIYIGTSVTSSGTYSLTGASAVLKVFGLEDVGVVSVGDVSDGQIDEFGGIFTQSAGSNTSTRSLIVGEYSGATGQYALSGGSYSDGGNIYLGDLGGATGVFSQSAGALTLAGFNRSVSLNSGTMIVNGGVAGLYGTGTFYQSGGIFTIGTGTTSSNLWVGVATTSLGNYSLTGPGAQLQVYGDEHIAVYAAGSTANNAITQSGGVFNQSNGTNSLTGNLFVADNAGATGQYNLGGGTCTVGSNLFLASGTGGIGAFQQTAGTLSVNGASSTVIFGRGIFVGYNGAGTFAQSGGITTIGSPTAEGDLLFGGHSSSAAGTYSLSGSTSALTAYGQEYLGVDGAGTFLQSGGTNTVIGSALSLYVGRSANGFYSLSGGTLIAPFETLASSGATTTGVFNQYPGATNIVGTSLTVADAGIGTYTQSGGTLSAYNITIANSVGSAGTYSMSGGTLSCSQSMGVGGNTSIQGGTGYFNLSGGTATVAKTLTVYKTGTVNFTGGSLSVGTLTTNGNPSNFVWSTGSLTIGPGSLLVDNSANAALGAIFTLNQGQALTVNGTFTINNTGTITLDNGILGGSGTFTNSGELSGTGTLLFTGPATNKMGGLIKVKGNKNQFTGTGGLNNKGTYQTNDPTMSIFSELTDDTTGVQIAAAGDSYQIFGDFINNSQQAPLWDTSQVDVEFSGGINHNLAWPGVDNGPTYAGFAYNFAIGTLELDSGDSLTLQPGGSAPQEALYVSDLQLDGAPVDPSLLPSFISSTITNLSSGTPLNVYYDAYSSGDAYLDDQTYALGNGGDLIPAPEPSCVALAGAGAGLLLRQRRRR